MHAFLDLHARIFSTKLSASVHVVAAIRLTNKPRDKNEWLAGWAIGLGAKSAGGISKLVPVIIEFLVRRTYVKRD